MNVIEFVSLTPREALREAYDALSTLGLLAPGEVPQWHVGMTAVVTDAWMPPSDMPLHVSKETH